MAHIHQTSAGQIEVSFPVREQQILITRAEYEVVRSHDNKVKAIKFIKDQYNLGLYEAKQVVDTIREIATPL